MSTPYLSFSGYEKYDLCPRLYWHQYVNKTTSSKARNKVHSLYGDVVGRLFATFYRKKLWTYDNVEKILLSGVDIETNKVIKKETEAGGEYNWNEPKLAEGNRSLDEVKEEIRQTIPRGLETIRFHHLVGTEASDELKLDIEIDGYKLGGRSDFIIKRPEPHSDLVIIDGKGTRHINKDTHKGSYTNPLQLKWYYALHKLKFNLLPDKVGFLYWRAEPKNALDWHPVNEADVAKLTEKALSSLKKIEQGKKRLTVLGAYDQTMKVGEFQARPKSDCRRCDFLQDCYEGKNFLAKKSIPIPELGVEDEDIGL